MPTAYLLDEYKIWRGETREIALDQKGALPSFTFVAPPGAYDSNALQRLVGGTWVASPEPTPTQPPAELNQREGDAGWFWLRLFTSTEQGTWNLIIKYAESLSISAMAADPWLFAAYNANQQIAKARTVSLDAPSVIAGVSSILRHTFAIDGLSLTVLANDTRRDEVLAGLVVA